MVKICLLRTIDPTLPSAYLDKLLGDDKDYGLNILKPITGACMEWLDNKPTGSVVYASMDLYFSRASPLNRRNLLLFVKN